MRRGHAMLILTRLTSRVSFLPFTGLPTQPDAAVCARLCGARGPALAGLPRDSGGPDERAAAATAAAAAACRAAGDPGQRCRCSGGCNCCRTSRPVHRPPPGPGPQLQVSLHDQHPVAWLEAIIRALVVG